MKKLTILLFTVFALCFLAPLTFAEVLRDIRFDGRPLAELGIEAKSSHGDYQGVITQLPETQIEGQGSRPWLLCNPTARSWTALVVDLKGLKLPVGTRVRLTVWVKSNRPGYVRVALSEGVSYGGDCRLLSRGQGMFPFVRQALILERVMVEENELLSAAVGWMCVGAPGPGAIVAPGASAAEDYTELLIASEQADILAAEVGRQLAATEKELSALQEAGFA